jgi:hypothetical protein
VVGLRQGNQAAHRGYQCNDDHGIALLNLVLPGIKLHSLLVSSQGLASGQRRSVLALRCEVTTWTATLSFIKASSASTRSSRMKRRCRLAILEVSTTISISACNELVRVQRPAQSGAYVGVLMHGAAIIRRASGFELRRLWRFSVVHSSCSPAAHRLRHN